MGRAWIPVVVVIVLIIGLVAAIALGTRDTSVKKADLADANKRNNRQRDMIQEYDDFIDFLRDSAIEHADVDPYARVVLDETRVFMRDLNDWERGGNSPHDNRKGRV